MLRWAVRLKGLEAANQKAVTVRHCVYCFGHDPYDKEKPIDVHVFDTVTLTWRKLTPGRGELHLQVRTRRYHTAVFIEDTIYLWGLHEYRTFSDKFSNVLHASDVETHTWYSPQVSGTVPEGRFGHSACVLRKDMFIHGGFIRGIGQFGSDTYKLNTSSVFWTLIHTRGTEAPVTGYHSATIIGTKMFVVGGYKFGPHNNFVRVLDTETNLWLDTTSAQLPERHCDHSAFTYNGELYIFFGFDICKNSNCIWKFDPKTFSWKKVELKGKGPLRWKSSMSCCMDLVGDRAILFDDAHDDLYILDLSPSLKTVCKPAVIRYRQSQSGLPHNIRWELAAMTSQGTSQTYEEEVSPLA